MTKASYRSPEPPSILSKEKKHPKTSESLTVFTGLDVQDVAPDAVSCLGVGQHLDAVVGELLQAPQLHLLPGGGDVLHFTPFCSKTKESGTLKAVTNLWKI